jgi:prophage regulatory protein
MNTNTLPQMVLFADVISATSLSRSTILRKIKAGTFPTPCKISAHRIAWRSADLNEWFESQAAGGAQ